MCMWHIVSEALYNKLLKCQLITFINYNRILAYSHIIILQNKNIENLKYLLNLFQTKKITLEINEARPKCILETEYFYYIT
jgi:hypothetical protein